MKSLFDWKRVEKEVHVITPEFQVWKNGKLASIVIYIKMSRGEMTRFILKNRIENPEDLKSFFGKGLNLTNLFRTKRSLYLLTAKKYKGMTEVEKMRSSQLADMSAPELQVRFEHAKKLLARMRGMSTYDEGYRELLDKLVPGIPETSIICPPFHCDHGDGIKLGEHVFVNANCTFLDGGYITIGAHTLVGPCVQIYTPHHPMDYRGKKRL